MTTNSSSSRTVRIGCAAGFWGDTNSAAFQLVDKAEIDYLVFDYLAEVTLSIMAGARMKNPEMGYAHDFVHQVMGPLASKIKEKGIKVVSNAGGVNPAACRSALQAVFEKAGVDMKIALVQGDDLNPRHDEFKQCREYDTGQPLPAFTLTMNAYLGAEPIKAALDAGADIVLTGRIADSVLALGPLLHEFNWSMQDYDKLAQGSLAGHVIECGAQCTGGNFTDWQQVPDFHNMGFPVAECHEDGSFIISKPDNTGGLVTPATVAEQIVYEIGNPGAYLLPDVVCDFSQVQLEQAGNDRVRVTGACGMPPTDTYKVSATWPDGHRIIASFLVGGNLAADKGQLIADSILKKVSGIFQQMALSPFRETTVELLGTETTYGAQGRCKDTREVVVKIGAVHDDKKALSIFSREIAQAATGMAPGLTGLVGGRPSPFPRIRLFSTLVPKDAVPVSIEMDGETMDVHVSAGETFSEPDPAGNLPVTDSSVQASADELATVPLVKLAWARSGDKGNHANIGVIARKPQYLPWLQQALTCEAIREYMQHVLDPDKGDVLGWELPGFNAMNFLLKNSLGGGGMASLRIDPQGKAFAQQLLDFPVTVSREIARELEQ